MKLIAAAVLVAFSMLYFVAGLTDIDPGEVGILVKKVGTGRGMQERTLDTGLQWVDPVTYDVVIYDVRFKQYDVPDVPTQTKDGQPVLVDVSLEIGLEDSLVPWLHEHVGKDYYEQVVYPALRSAIRDKVPSQESDVIYTSKGREEVQLLIQSVLNQKMASRGIAITVNLRDIDFTNSDFIELLEQKAGAAQKVIIEERNASAAEQTAIKTANIAEGEKQKRIKAAEADREERRLEGEGERLKQEEIAKGILAVRQAEAEGNRLQVSAFGDGHTYATVRWAEELGDNFQIYGYPTGAPGTASFVDLNGVFKGVFAGGGK